jgi:hypothetical protein
MKDFHLYLRRGVLFVPTTGIVEKGFHRGMDPVESAPISETAAARQVLRSAIARGNPPAPPYSAIKDTVPAVARHGGFKSWSAFSRGAMPWNIREENGIYQIIGFWMHPDRYWKEDGEQTIEFPPGTNVDDVIDRMIAILQDAARS